MITKEEFAKLISEYQRWSKRIDEVSEVLNSYTFFECDWINYTFNLFDKTLGFLFNEDGIDDINWWLFERSGNPDIKMWDANDKEIPTETVDDLWEIVKDNRK